MKHDSGTPQVEATITSIRILEAIDESGVGVTQLATRLDMHKSTVYKHLSTLEQLGYVVKTDNKYHLGPRLAQLGETMKRQHGLHQRSQSVIDQLAEMTEEFVGFTIEYGHREYDVYSARGRLALRSDELPVRARKLHCTAAGKAILAQFPQELLQEYIESTELTSHTDRTITDPDTLFSAIDRIKERNIAFDREEQKEGIRSVAAPYRDGPLNLYGAIYVQGPVDRMTGKRFEEDIPGMIHSAIEKIESR